MNVRDVVVVFTPDEWIQLSQAQRALYQEVMLETYSHLVALGKWKTSEALAVWGLIPGGTWRFMQEGAPPMNELMGLVCFCSVLLWDHIWQCSSRHCN